MMSQFEKGKKWRTSRARTSVAPTSGKISYTETTFPTKISTNILAHFRVFLSLKSGFW